MQNLIPNNYVLYCIIFAYMTAAGFIAILVVNLIILTVNLFIRETVNSQQIRTIENKTLLRNFITKIKNEFMIIFLVSFVFFIIAIILQSTNYIKP